MASFFSSIMLNIADEKSTEEAPRKYSQAFPSLLLVFDVAVGGDGWIDVEVVVVGKGNWAVELVVDEVESDEEHLLDEEVLLCCAGYAGGGSSRRKPLHHEAGTADRCLPIDESLSTWL